MEGKLSTTEDRDGGDDASGSPTRRRVLKASAALGATGIVGGSAFVGHVVGSHRADIDCPGSVQSSAAVEFKAQTVGDCVRGTCGPDSVKIDRIEVTCPGGGWVDLHDKARSIGPCGRTWKAGYPVGASTLYSQGTFTDQTIPLFDCPPTPDAPRCSCIQWNRCNWPSDTMPSATRSMGAMLHLDDPDDDEITHYCKHESPTKPPDPAYLVHGDNSTFPVQTVREVTGDGDDCGTCDTV